MLLQSHQSYLNKSQNQGGRVVVPILRCIRIRTYSLVCNTRVLIPVANLGNDCKLQLYSQAD